MSLSDITIIMVTYNSAHLIADALSVLPKGTPAVIIDNASQDDTCAKIKNHKRAGLKLIRNKKNVGFGTANNTVLRQCKTRYALMLNPDAKIKAADVRKLQAALEADDKAVMAGPLISDRVISDITSEGGKIRYRFQPYPLFHRNNPLFRPLFRRPTKYRRLTDLETPQNCGFISGAVMLYDLRKMPKPQYFDEDIFLYYEESELQSRIVGAGYKLLLEPRARAEHIGNASSRWTDAQEKIAVHFYHTGYTRGVLAAKYPERVNRFDMLRFVWRAKLLALLSVALGKRPRAKYRVKYSARLTGFKEGYDYGRC